MSVTNVTAYFRTRLRAISPRLREWRGGFNFNNVPENLINDSYHLESGSIVVLSQNQHALDMEYPIILRLYSQGFTDVTGAIDDAFKMGELISADIVKPENANTSGIKTVSLESMETSAKDGQQTSIVLLTINFTARVMLDVR